MNTHAIKSVVLALGLGAVMNVGTANATDASAPADTAERALYNGINLQGINLQGINLQGINLQGINLQGINLQGWQFQGISAQGWQFQGISAQGWQFQGSQRQGAEAQQGGGAVELKGVRLVGGRLVTR